VFILWLYPGLIPSFRHPGFLCSGYMYVVHHHLERFRVPVVDLMQQILITNKIKKITFLAVLVPRRAQHKKYKSHTPLARPIVANLFVCPFVGTLQQVR